ncbi:MAG: fibronectin type III domain-containing protein [Nitrospirae bacterium]|nr:fibronectin type III domain-containing protein [Nitrospirota bacterium]
MREQIQTSKYTIIFLTFIISLLNSCGVDGKSSQGSSNSAALSWEPPTTNVDGTELTDLAGFKIYYGKTSGTYSEVIDINNSIATEHTIEGLAEGTYYFATTAYDTTGNESYYSNEVIKTIR